MRRPMELDEVADGILDGTVIDWSNVDADAALVEQLKTLQTLRLRRRTAAAPDPPGPWNWGHLKVLERIGLGAYGDVYRAWDSRLDREVALKLLPADDSSDGVSTSTVIEEGRLLARVRHPNVVTIYGAERIDGRVGLWMELINGRTLEEALRSGRTFSAAEATRLGAELCSAVSAVHAAGLLHRDIKAQNIMLDESGRLVLMDFGTGREFSDASSAHVAGTPLYLAPEVLAGRPATPASEVYGIGVVLFRLLTNSYPVVAGSVADLRRAHEAGGAVEASLDRAHIPARLRQVLARALDGTPGQRYDSADRLRDALVRSAPALWPRRWVMSVAGALAIATAMGLAWNSIRAPLIPAPAIVVLPFTDAGSDPGNDDFIDGLTSEVIRKLNSIDGLVVRPRTSSFFYKGRPRNIREVATHLGVDLVLEATVQRAGNTLRVSPQLLRAGSDVPLWSELFDRTIDNMSSIQDEIAGAIASRLRLRLGGGQRRMTTNSEAYDFYLRGRALAERGGTENGKNGAVFLNLATQLDSEFALAWAALAQAYAAMSWQPSGLTDGQGIAAMRPVALRAIELAPELPEAHAAMGLVYARERDWEQARNEFETAIAATPYSSDIVVMYAANVLYQLGEAAEAEAMLEDALRQDPWSFNVMRELAVARFVGGRFKEAADTFQELKDADPTYEGRNVWARALTLAGRPDEAIAMFDSDPGPREWERWLLPAYIAMNRFEDRDRLILENKDELLPHRQAIIQAALRDTAETIDALNRAIDVNPQRVAFMLVSPDFAFLRGDPGYKALRQRLNLPPLPVERQAETHDTRRDDRQRPQK